MSLIIKDIEMPKEPDEMIEIAIFGDGNVIQTGESWRSPENGKCYYTTTTPEKFFNAVPVQPHGRLIDADALLSLDRQIYDGEIAVGRREYIFCFEVEDAPTVIEAEEGET